MNDINIEVSKAYYIGEKYSKLLEKLDILTLKDLVYYYPIRYEDSRNVINIEDIIINNKNIIKGRIIRIKSIYTKNRKNIINAEIEDNTGIAKIIWFNQPFITNSIYEGSEIIISGIASFEKGYPLFKSPEYDIIKENKENIHLSRITPIYNQTKGITSKWLRSRIKSVLDQINIEDYIPQDIREKYDLLEINIALKKLHFPENFDDISKAKRRLGFEEILYIQIISYLRKEERKRRSSYKIVIDRRKVDKFIDNLDFKLTKSQIRSINEIYSDIEKDIPMNRLLEGDVGSGKTIVALITAYITHLNNLQIAIMVPTSILAQQHYNYAKNLFNDIRIQLITAKTKRIDRSASIFIGTHALLSNKDIFKNLGLVIIDEQHRFGIRQRETLVDKGHYPHILTMTATPIPRTLALGIYGDLDISRLDQMPTGRIKVKTYIVPSEKREDSYKFIKDRVAKGEQVFILCPLISESEKLQLRNVEQEYKNLKENYFTKERIILLHGKTKDKDNILSKFKDKEYDILVSTPIIEVGIDIPDATIMLIEDAERFGLAQLHQLRGRVGRSNKQSYCFLFTSNPDNDRLKFFSKNNDGLELAEFDLLKRGPGEIYGKNQSGNPDLKMASLLDKDLIKITKDAVIDIVKVLDKYPLLEDQVRQVQSRILSIN
jgi:ATP-dependent DNA helicase RecG